MPERNRFTMAVRRAALVISLLASGSAAHAAIVVYDFVDVGYVIGSGNVTTNTIAEEFRPVSSNLPVTFTSGDANYRFGSLADPGSQSSGSWRLTNGTDSLFGSIQVKTEQPSFAGSVFYRYTWTSTVEGGTGYFAGATGSGTGESFSVYTGTGVPDTFAYQGVSIGRASVTVNTSAPIIQSDVRPVYVLVKNGVENLVTGEGSNVGPFTSASPGLAALANEAVSYTFQPLPIAGPPFAGTFVDTGPGGTVSGTSVGNTIAYNHRGTFFSYAPGTSITTGGTGVFSEATGSSEYEAFGWFIGGPTDAQTYSSVNVVRLNPVPEPSEFAMLIAGLGLLGIVAGRRKSR